ncbi:MAG: DUF177 domain-containing protein [Bacilli bacterium]|nr:DUF177 domain-containing protein [Bacilli bacterium]
MKIDLTKLIHNYIEELNINEEIIFSDSYLENSEIKQISPIQINGFIKVASENLYALNLTVTGEMTLTCAVTLEDVVYPISFQIEEILSENEEKEENYIKIINNTIDIMPIIWQNILMEVPLKVTSPKAEKINLSGDDWELIRE